MTYPAHAFEFIQASLGQRGFYESNYLKANSPDGKRAFWIKYNILAPSSDRYPAVAELWLVLWDRDRSQTPLVVKEVHLLAGAVLSADRVYLELGDCLLTADRARGRITDPVAAWDLGYTGEGGPLFHLPSAGLYTGGFPKKKLLTPIPRARFEGQITAQAADGAEWAFDVDRWVGLRGHNWGREHAYSYAYGNSNLFNRRDMILDGFTARIRVAGLLTPWLSAQVLRLDAGDLGFNRVSGWLAPAVVDFPRWEVTLQAAHGRLKSTWEAPRETFAGLRYLHPDGRVSYCYNTKFATCRASLAERAAAETQFWVTEMAELEFLFPEPVAGIPLHGEASLDELAG